MTKISIYSLNGKKVGEEKISSEVFGLSDNDQLLHQVYVSQRANQRQVIAHTKNRSERAGSGKKPWKQKGTGNARTGSIRNPIWRGGGIVFGPTKNRNFKKNINQKMKQKAIKIALSAKIRNERMIVVDKLEIKEKKTQAFAKALEKLKIKGSLLVGFNQKESDNYLYLRNIANTKGILENQINVLDMLNYKYLLLSIDSVKSIEKRYSKSKK